MSIWVRSSFFLVSVGVLWGCFPEPAAEQPLRSMVIITIDTLRADHLGSYGYFRPTSPVLDKLADESVWFGNAMTTMATTLPAHVSLFTSRYPVQTGVTSNGRRLSMDGTMQPRGMGGTENRVRLLAQMMKELGYRTAGFVSATPVKSYTGISAGFDVFDEPEVGGRPGSETTDQVLGWLDGLKQPQADPSEPFFLWIHYFDPHNPYDPPEAFRIFETDGQLIQFLQDRGVEDPMDAEIHDFNNLYDGEILSTDHEVGRVLDRLRALELYNDSTLVVTSDHGEGMGQHGWIRHGEIHNEQLFVPLMIKFPRALRVAPQRIDRLVSLIDVVPTLAARLNLPFDASDRARFSGVDAMSSRPMRKYALAQRSTVARHSRLEKRGQREKFALVSRRWKYFFNNRGPDELFDMESDRHELNDLSQIETETAQKIRENLLAEIARYSGQEDFRVVEESLPSVLEELRALGYLQDGFGS